MHDSSMKSAGEDTDAGDTARDFRASLGDRREAEGMITAALAARQQAAAYAGDVVRQAEVLASEIEREARAAARAIAVDAEAIAESLVAEARDEASRITAAAELAVHDARAAAADTRAIAEAIQAQAEADLAQAREETDLLRQTARLEVAAQRKMARAAVDEQASRTVARLESMTREVQSALERATHDFGGTAAQLSDFRVPGSGTGPGSAEPVDLLAPMEADVERPRPFQAVR